jgi:hypothetical protein
LARAVTEIKIDSYLTEKGKGNPIEILKIASDLRHKFIPARDYIKNEKSSLYNSLQTLNEICSKLLDEAYRGKPSKHKKVIENIKDISFGPVAVSVFDLPEIKREGKIEGCVIAFTELIEDLEAWNSPILWKKRRRCRALPG